MNEAFLLTGGNMGERADFLARAGKAVAAQCGKVMLASSVYETAAWGMEDQGAFLNQVLQIRTELEPRALLEAILQIETTLGRKREQRYGPRTIDIDILFFNDAVVDLPGLHIPHPRIPERRFVLEPLAEIAPHMVHPVLHRTMTELLALCTDPLAVHKFS